MKKCIQRHVVIASKIKEQMLEENIWDNDDEGNMKFESTKKKFNSAIIKGLKKKEILCLADVFDITCIKTANDEIFIEYYTETDTKTCKCGITTIPMFELLLTKKVTIIRENLKRHWP